VPVLEAHRRAEREPCELRVGYTQDVRYV